MAMIAHVYRYRVRDSYETIYALATSPDVTFETLATYEDGLEEWEVGQVMGGN